MREDWRELLIKSVYGAIELFILSCIVFKLLLDKSNWLEMSIIWSILFYLGDLVRKSFRPTSDEAFTICVSISIILVFLFGVVLDMQDWGKMVFYLSCPFIMAMYW